MIKGRIAQILSDTEVILNIGSLDGVKPNMEFVIYSEGERVFDPQSGTDLGVIENVKGRVISTNVQEKITRAVTQSYSVTVPSLVESLSAASSMSASFMGRHTETRQVKLKVRQEQLKPLRDFDSTVAVGDFVREV